jgi:endonuclease V-like protein UPF0215 family
MQHRAQVRYARHEGWVTVGVCETPGAAARMAAQAWCDRTDARGRLPERVRVAHVINGEDHS